jgi:tetratricopeptide (TPR) repeat protein
MTDTPGKIQDFVNSARSFKGYEKGEGQEFCVLLFQAFGHKGCIEAGAKLEYRLKSPGKHTKYPDLVWRPRLLLEMKSRGEKLEEHHQQVFEYWDKLLPQPRYIVLCNFDEFWIYDSTLQIEEPINRVKLEELPTQYTALNFLFPGNNAISSDHNRDVPAERLYNENIPPSGAVQLFGREQELERLHQLLTTPAPETKGGKQQDKLMIAAIVGMGGVGKTELAIRYAWQHLQGRGVLILTKAPVAPEPCAPTAGVCWVDARDGDVGIQLVNFARSFLNLNPPEDWDLLTQLKYCWRNWQLPPQPPLNKGGRKEEWLIVIDDVTNYRQQVKPYLPPESSQFKILLTAREEFGRPIENLSLNKLQRDAALDLLKSLVGVQRIQQELEIAEQLCRQFLDYLPLGLELLGRYLERSPDLLLKAMLSLLEKKRLRHKSVLEADATMTAKLGVADAFELSWERLDEDAQFLGCLLSLFASADIPWDLVKLAYSNMILPEDGEVDLDILEEARADLVRFYLLQRTGKETYRLHQLIREFLREKREELGKVNELKQGFVDAMVIVAKQVPEPGELTRELFEMLTPMIHHLAEAATVLTDWLNDEDLCLPFLGIGRFYKSQGFYAQAEPWYEQCQAIAQTRLGLLHPQVVANLSNLADLYREQGRYREAEPLFLQALELLQSSEETAHSLKVALMNNLALLYQDQGRYREAEPLFLQALELHRGLYGDEPSLVALSLNNLGNFFHSQRRYKEAESLFLESLKLHQSLYGDEHPLTAESLNNLGSLYLSQCRDRDAEPLLLQALEVTRCSRGEENREVATRLGNLGNLYFSQGRYREAELLLLEALELDKRLLGEKHPDVAIDLHNLAKLYYEQNRYQDAEPLFLQALELSRLLGIEEHFYVLTSCANLVEIYESQGRNREAEPLLLQILELDKRLQGEDDPNLAAILSKLADIYLSQGRYSEAEPLYLQVLELSQRLLGENHVNVAASLNNLASLYNYQGRYREAQSLHLQALELRKGLQGENHPDVANSLNNLASLYYEQGRLNKAEPLFVQALEIFQQRLGLEHSHTVICQKNLTNLRDILNSATKDLPNFNQKPKKGNYKNKPKGFSKE